MIKHCNRQQAWQGGAQEDLGRASLIRCLVCAGTQHCCAAVMRCSAEAGFFGSLFCWLSAHVSGPVCRARQGLGSGCPTAQNMK